MLAIIVLKSLISVMQMKRSGYLHSSPLFTSIPLVESINISLRVIYGGKETDKVIAYKEVKKVVLLCTTKVYLHSVCSHGDTSRTFSGVFYDRTRKKLLLYLNQCLLK